MKHFRVFSILLATVAITATSITVQASEIRTYLQSQYLENGAFIDEVSVDLYAPQNIDASYRHKGPYSVLPDHLRVTFDDVDSAVKYEIEVTKKSGESEIYTSLVNGLLIYAGEESFISDCIAGGTVRVRSIDAGGTKSEWSEYIKISHNMLHFG